jgi:hypothetical protein
MKVILSVPDEGYSERPWWRLFQKCTMCTNLDMYIFITSICTNCNQGFHLKPVAAEIRRLHFTLPPATFYVSRIKNV